MSPRIEEHTLEIIKCLFEDANLKLRSGSGEIETDGKNEDDFDAVIIADKLRQLADEYDEERIQPLINALQRAAADQAVKAFGDAVEILCQSPVATRAEVASEMQLLKASVALGLYVKKKSPDLRSKVERAMAVFLNTRVVGWVRDQGGWEQVASV